MTDRKPRMPRGLGKSGGALWRDVLAVYALDAHEVRLLVELCRQVDLVEELQNAIDTDGVMVANATGEGRRVHPAAIEIRQSRLVVARLCAALRLPDSGEDDVRGQQRVGVRGVYALRERS